MKLFKRSKENERLIRKLKADFSDIETGFNKLKSEIEPLKLEIARLKDFKTETENNIRLKQFKKLVGKDVSIKEGDTFIVYGSIKPSKVKGRDIRGKLLSVRTTNKKFEIVIKNVLGMQVFNYSSEDLIYIKKYVS